MSNIVRLKKFLETIKKYDTYSYKHSGDILLVIFSFIMIMIVFSYVAFKKKAYYYKKNWSKYRCDPGITPFAGFINAPEGSNFADKVDYTIKNFTKCNHEIMNKNIAEITSPASHVASLLQSFFIIIVKAFNSVKKIVLETRDRAMKVIDTIMQKLFNIVTEFTSFFSHIKDTLMKTAGVFVNVLFLVVAYGYTFVTFLYNLVTLLIYYIVILVLIIIIMFLVILILHVISYYTAVTYPILSLAIQKKIIPKLLKRFVIPTTISIVVNIGILIAVTVGVSYISKALMEQERTCFYEDTIIETKLGFKKIKDLKPGDILKNNNIVESIIELNNKNQENLYKINDVYVTGGHYVYTDEEGWIKVEDSKKSVKTVYIPDVLYCLVTSKKEIIINNTKFSDWDDLENHELMYLKNTFNVNKTEKINSKINSLLHPKTIIKCKDGFKHIEDIEKGDILSDNNKVYGVVKSLPPEIVLKYKLNNTEIIGKKIHFNNLGDYMKINHEIFKDNDSKYYYHLLTSSGNIKINNSSILDYNGCVENILDNNLKLQ